MTKRYFVGPHQAADLKVNGLWDPETMTTDKAEAAAASKVASMQPPTNAALQPDHSAPMKPPVLSDIVVDTSPHIESPPTQPERPVSMKGPVESAPATDQNAQPIAGAADLLRMLAPLGPWTIRSFVSYERGSPKCPRDLGYHGIGPDSADDRENGLYGWIGAAEAGKHNCHLHVAICSPAAADKPKLSKTDIIGSRAVWVDVDPIGVRFEESRAEILAAMQAEAPPFSCIVDSGNGYQAYKFIEPHRIDGDPEKIKELEQRNYAIAESLNRRLIGTGLKADSCHSVDHLMRLPGSTNFMTQKKLEKGYPPGNRPARIVEWHPELIYELSALPSVPLPQDGTPKGEEEFKDSGKYERIAPDDPRLMALLPKWIEMGLKGDVQGKFTKGGTTDRSRMAIAFAAACVRAKIDDQVIASILLDPSWVVGECIRDKGSAINYNLKRTIKTAHKFADDDPSKPAVLGKDTWDDNADKFISREMPNVRCYGGEFYDYEDGTYIMVPKKTVMHAHVREFLHSSIVIAKFDDNNRPVYAPFNPNDNDIKEMLSAIGDRRIINEKTTLPCWLEGAAGPPPRECIALRNGILHVPTNTLHPATEDFFTFTALPYDYHPEAQCPLWLSTISEYWPPKEDGSPANEVLLLQEMLGYLLLPDTSLHKFFFFLGPTRSGKGTIIRVLHRLLGERNVADPSIGSLGEKYGLAGLVGKSAALIAEFGWGTKDDRGKITRIVKSIVGEDHVNIERKYLGDLYVKLLVRFVMAGNKVPQFSDDSLALGVRLIAIRMTRSFADKPNTKLTDLLAEELPGILNWALQGYARLRAGTEPKFTETAAGKELSKTINRLASPVRTFVEDRCAQGDGEPLITEQALYQAYVVWCLKNNTHAMPTTSFIEAVLEAFPAISKHSSAHQERGDWQDRPPGEPQGYSP